MPFNRRPQVVALDAAACGGVGVDFVARLPPELTRRVLMHLTAKQLAQVGVVNRAWASAAIDDAVWAAAFDVSYGDDAAERVAAMAIGEDPPKRDGDGGGEKGPFTEEELRPVGGWRRRYLERSERARSINRRLAEREAHIRKYASGKGNEVVASMAGLELSGASYFSGR